YKVVSAVVALRASADEEIVGLDLTEHGERGYNAGLFAGAPSFISDAEVGEIKFFPSISGSQS
ncbi:MAG: ammonium transporter, partial [Selenomonadaceae bacterium]|nr:ammonium transporter [Selenomonadaceae bacterium]